MDSSPDTPSRLPDNVSLAMAYVPFQQWGDVYSMDEALNRGTLFPDLEFPFERGGTRK
ncbi:MAG: spore coat associated protein CotJA [Ruminococcus sp.]|nr:spore coat associated protein CotJA [Ruminococcus sp.]